EKPMSRRPRVVGRSRAVGGRSALWLRNPRITTNLRNEAGCRYLPTVSPERRRSPPHSAMHCRALGDFPGVRAPVETRETERWPRRKAVAGASSEDFPFKARVSRGAPKFG